MVKDCHTISMDGSKYSWEQADKRANQLNLKRSEYIYQLVEKDLDGKKRDYRLVDVITVCILCVIVLLFLVVLL